PQPSCLVRARKTGAEIGPRERSSKIHPQKRLRRHCNPFCADRAGCCSRLGLGRTHALPEDYNDVGVGLGVLSRLLRGSIRLAYSGANRQIVTDETFFGRTSEAIERRNPVRDAHASTDQGLPKRAAEVNSSIRDFYTARELRRVK